MKIKKSLLVLLPLFTVLFIAFPIMASSEDFYDEAIEFYQNNCSENIKGPKTTGIICYLFDKTTEMDEDLASLEDRTNILESGLEQNSLADENLGSEVSDLETRTSNLESGLELNNDNDSNLESRVTDLESVPSPTSKSLNIYESGGSKLGIYTHDDSFFYEPLGLIVMFDEGNGMIKNNINPVFYNDDCTGTAYYNISETDMNRMVNKLLSAGLGRYYIVERGTPSESFYHQSELRHDGCYLSYATSDGARELIEVSVGFSNPIPLPVEYQYE